MSFRVAIFAVVGVEEEFTFSTSTFNKVFLASNDLTTKIPTIKYDFWKELYQAKLHEVTVKHKMRFLSKFSD